jgi:3-hydroxyacyl-CoA dehydrogenase
MYKIEHVAVIGAGIMGGQIAAFFANLGITCDLCDIDIDIVERTLAKIADPTTKIATLYTPRFVKRIRPQSSTEIASFLKKADMIVEAIPEKMELKHKLFAEVARYRREDAIVTTNTSGLSIAQMASVMPASMAQHFAGIHYFNPVRYMPLIEVIPGSKTNPEIVQFLLEFYESVGKKALVCKDTPNFVANRIGVFGLMKTLSLMEKYNFDLDTVDAITGSPLGNPNTATMRLCDIVGIDTLVEVALNIFHNCPKDECLEIFKPHPWLQRMVSEKMLGEKTGKGFYHKSRDGVLSLDLVKWEYRPQRKVQADVLQATKTYQNAEDKIRVMCSGDSPIHRFAQELLLSTAAYSLNRIGEICEYLWAIDSAMKWGFRREIGPIEVLDVIGLEQAKEWMEDLNIPIPPLCEKIWAKTARIYKTTATTTQCVDAVSLELAEVPQPHQFISLQVVKAGGKTVHENLSSRLLDLGDGVLLLELDHKMAPGINPIDQFVVAMMGQIAKVMKQGGFKALVIGNQGANFSAGANLQMLQELCKEKQWDKIAEVSGSFQKINMNLYHANFPVVVAPHGQTLGGGMEITLAGHKRVALAEFYGGLVETGVGLVPGGAGNLLLLLQFMDILAAKNPGPMAPVSKTFELIGYGTVSTSAYDAIDKGLLIPTDFVVINKDEQILRAKEAALTLVNSFMPRPTRDIYLPGVGGYAALESRIDELVIAGKITPHSAFVAKKQAYILTGGKKASVVSPITEEEFLALERDAFVSLCGEPKSQERIAYMLKNKKPLIN